MRSALFIQSIEKAIKVLNVFGRGDRSMGLSEIALHSGLDKPSTQRCVYTLVELGYLEKCAKTSRLSLGKKCLDLSFHFLSNDPLVRTATPVLTKLRNDCGERTNLSLYDGSTLVYAIRLAGKNEDFFFSTLIGRRMPAFCSAGGRAMLAQLPIDEMKAIIGQSDLVPLTRSTITDPRQIWEKIMEARERGYGMVVEESVASELTVAAAIVDSAGRPLGAVHVAGSTATWSVKEYERRFAPLVVEVAASLSASNTTLGVRSIA
jgi:IclR family pca regulon transcriptional regulator